MALAILRRQINGDKPIKWPRKIIGEHLDLGPVLDMPDAIVWISDTQLREWGITLYEALELARENLSEIRGVISGVKGSFYIFHAPVGNVYASSWLILLELIRQLKVKGDYIAAVPSRDVFLITGVDDVDGLGLLIKEAEEAFTNGVGPLSGVVFRMEGDEWLPWLPADRHPHARAFKLLANRSRGKDYGKQAVLLNQLKKKTGEGMFVATVMISKKS